MKASAKFSRKLRLKHYAPVKLVERKLGRERDRTGRDKYAWGQYSSDGIIEIDPRQREQTRLDTILHELMHHIDPELSERMVAEAAGICAKILWEDGWRRVRL